METVATSNAASGQNTKKVSLGLWEASQLNDCNKHPIAVLCLQS